MWWGIEWLYLGVSILMVWGICVVFMDSFFNIVDVL